MKKMSPDPKPGGCRKDGGEGLGDRLKGWSMGNIFLGFIYVGGIQGLHLRVYSWLCIEGSLLAMLSVPY